MVWEADGAMHEEATLGEDCLYFGVGVGWERWGICDFLSSVHVIDGRLLICKRAREFWSHYTYRHGRESVTCFGGEFRGCEKLVVFCERLSSHGMRNELFN